VPDRAEFLRTLGAFERNIAGAMRRRLLAWRQALAQHERGLARAHPGARLRQHAQRLDELEQRLQRAVLRKTESARLRLANAQALLGRSSPARRLAALRTRLEAVNRRLPVAIARSVQHARERCERSMRTLHAVSPLATLERGYAIVTDAVTGRVLTDAATVRTGAQIDARLARGSLRATVTDAGVGGTRRPEPGKG
jgi:exodeoxyribonuclease VII large subunit